MLRSDQHGRAKMLDCSIEFPFLEKSTAQAALGQKVIRPHRERLLVMHYRFVDPFLLKESTAQRDLSIRIVRFHGDGFLPVHNRLVYFAFAQKRRPQIILSIPPTGL